jgi:hypothetical protein
MVLMFWCATAPRSGTEGDCALPVTGLSNSAMPFSTRMRRSASAAMRAAVTLTNSERTVLLESKTAGWRRLS